MNGLEYDFYTIIILIGVTRTFIARVSYQNAQSIRVKNNSITMIVISLFLDFGGIIGLLNTHLWHNRALTFTLIAIFTLFIILIAIDYISYKKLKSITNSVGHLYSTDYDRIFRSSHMFFLFLGPELLVINNEKKIVILMDKKLNWTPELLYNEYYPIFRNCSRDILNQYIKIMKSDYEIL